MNEKVKEIKDRVEHFGANRLLFAPGDIKILLSEIERLEVSVNHTACHSEVRLLRQQIERLERERDMWLQDDVKQNNAVGRLIVERDEKDRRIAELEAVAEAAKLVLPYLGIGGYQVGDDLKRKLQALSNEPGGKE